MRLAARIYFWILLALHVAFIDRILPRSGGLLADLALVLDVALILGSAVTLLALHYENQPRLGSLGRQLSLGWALFGVAGYVVAAALGARGPLGQAALGGILMYIVPGLLSWRALSARP